MCLLTFCPHGVTPDREFLNNGCWANPDGFGYAMLDFNILTPAGYPTLVVRKSLSATDLLDKFFADREHIKGPALFHSRYATAGLKDESNCHPFRVGADRHTVVGHNGIISECTPVDRKDPRSDTAIWAAHVLPSHNPFTAKGRLAAEKFLGSYNKAVIISADLLKYPHGYVILNESAGKWAEDGCWYSNTGYCTQPWRTRYGTMRIGSETRDDFRDWYHNGYAKCECGKTIWNRSMYCHHCYRCNDCGEYAALYECACYEGYYEVGTSVASTATTDLVVARGTETVEEVFARFEREKRKRDLEVTFRSLPDETEPTDDEIIAAILREVAEPTSEEVEEDIAVPFEPDFMWCSFCQTNTHKTMWCTTTWQCGVCRTKNNYANDIYCSVCGVAPRD